MNITQSSIRSARDQVYYWLKEDIMKFRLIPGTHISEKEISGKYEVSRTPVREAFLQLAKEGLLEIYPQKGTRVSLIDLDLVEEARFMRENLDGLFQFIITAFGLPAPHNIISYSLSVPSYATISSCFNCINSRSLLRHNSVKKGRPLHVKTTLIKLSQLF